MQLLANLGANKLFYLCSVLTKWWNVSLLYYRQCDIEDMYM